ncbi:MAG: UbiA family prenyltransferase [Planctomycetaceae bacterium]
MLDFIRLCRLYYALPLSLTYLLTLVYVMGGSLGAQWASASASTVALALLIAFGHVMNDVCDVAADRINNPRRPLAAGRVRRREGALLCGCCWRLRGWRPRGPVRRSWRCWPAWQWCWRDTTCCPSVWGWSNRSWWPPWR